MVVVIGIMAVKSSSDGKIELNFISSRVSTKLLGHNENTEVLINLQECHDIDRPSEDKRWSDMFITPLRDRSANHIMMCCHGDCYQDNDILVVWT